MSNNVLFFWKKAATIAILRKLGDPYVIVKLPLSTYPYCYKLQLSDRAQKIAL